MQKRLFALSIALTFSLLNFGDRRPVVAQPYELPTALFIPGPPIVVHHPLPLSADQRVDVQEIQWELKTRQDSRERATLHRATDPQTLESNPLPAISSALADLYTLIHNR